MTMTVAFQHPTSFEWFDQTVYNNIEFLDLVQKYNNYDIVEAVVFDEVIDTIDTQLLSQIASLNNDQQKLLLTLSDQLTVEEAFNRVITEDYYLTYAKCKLRAFEHYLIEMGFFNEMSDNEIDSFNAEYYMEYAEDTGCIKIFEELEYVVIL
jgi:hypothetical protein